MKKIYDIKKRVNRSLTAGYSDYAYEQKQRDKRKIALEKRVVRCVIYRYSQEWP